MKKLLIALALLPSSMCACTPITRESLAHPLPNPATGMLSPRTAEEHMTRSLEIIRIGTSSSAVSGSSVAAVEAWGAAAPDRIINALTPHRSTSFRHPNRHYS